MGENGNRPVRVNDPILRSLVAVVGALASWSLVQVNDHSKILAAMSEKQTYIQASQHQAENRNDMIVGEIRRDVREIRSMIEKRTP